MERFRLEHALFIEMKAEKGRLSAGQKRWKDFLIAGGNSWHLCRSAEEAIEVIKWYLGEDNSNETTM